MWLLVLLILYCVLAKKLFHRGGLAFIFVLAAFIIGLFMTILSDALGDISFILLLIAGFFFMAYLHQQDIQFAERAAPRVLDFLEDVSHFCPGCCRVTYISHWQNPGQVKVALTIINEEDAQMKKELYDRLIDSNLNYDDVLTYFFDNAYKPKHPDLCMDIFWHGKMEDFGLQDTAFSIEGGSDIAVRLLAKKVQEKYTIKTSDRGSFSLSVEFHR